MTIRSLEIFVKVAECGKMSEVARNMYITQSSVSQAISEIEKEYGVKLFDRISKKLYLTEAGKKLLGYGRHLLAVNEEMNDCMKHCAKNIRIRVGATVTVGTCVISPIMLELYKVNPLIEPEVFVEDTRLIAKKLLNSELDIAIVEGKIKHPDIVTKSIINDNLVLICSHKHEFYKRDSIKVSELSNQPLIMRELGSGTRAQLEKQLKELKIPMNIRWSCYNSEAILRAVVDNFGIAVISELLIEDYLKKHLLWACDIEGINLHRTFDIAYHRSKFFTENISAFFDISVEYGKKQARKKSRSVNSL
ncbi:TPA: LysR family transcriptional regulator [Clostridioides difficile]|uniref:Transcriptional regulator, LysR family n=10 Tax=Clostridioides difficile TaxID=1496 RepID=Q187A8_CLOD6|nr:LysR family transcriptional regulator [Clostridioides difficile]EQG60959.1 bacterial regulatory helix-turn-helix, lysR family protein [Clostridioides difficile DA00149]EQK92263.1 bacterial regulatory helix-turn-helix, lysR family protein [Clostridioides difficile CD127]OFU00174.1 LysR family transcriptional regulator [Clostridium sp. HMSC19E03]OFU06989.1 LysR family transcriptional regulator [Clostridium sp. HMSC19D07]OFU12259.1 LysR family transcriptional regulator [Clostridium sp. HMSC19D